MKHLTDNAKPKIAHVSVNDSDHLYNLGRDDMIKKESRADKAITGLYTLTSLKRRWPNGIIPYEYNAALSSYSKHCFYPKTFQILSDIKKSNRELKCKSFNNAK